MTHRTRFIFLALMITIGMPVAANSAINKCVGTDGKVVFSDQPCSTRQAATTIQAPAKPLPSSRKPVVEDGPSSTDHSRPIVLAYDTLCAEDKRLYVRDAGKLSPEDQGMRKERLDKSCNPQMRLAAVEQDKENLVQVCIIKREELKQIRSLPERPLGYANRAPEIASDDAWLKENCN